MRSKNSTKWYSIIAGTVFLLILLVVFIFIPCPTNPQLNFFRILIAIAAGAFAATIPGAMKFTNTMLTATGAVAVFALVYLVNPAGWKEEGDCTLKNFKATIYIDGKLKKDVEVIFPSLGKSSFTDSYGTVNMDYSVQQIKYPFKIIMKYKTEIDTTVVVDKSLEDVKELQLKSDNKIKTEGNLSDNSISFQYGDLNLNLSLINTNKTDPEYNYEDTVSYRFSKSSDTIYINPHSRILNQIKEDKPVKGLTEEICLNYPMFDFKIANNTDEAIFLNEIQLGVIKSEGNNSAFILPQGISAIGFYNAGWGDAKNVSVAFSVSPDKTYSGWKNQNWQHQIRFGTVGKGGTESAYASIEIRELMKDYGLTEQAFELGEMADLKDPINKYNAAFQNAAGDFDQGGIAYGIFSYTDANGENRKLKFETSFEISGGYGAVAPISAEYNTKLKTNGQNYTLSTSVSQGIKPKDLDRFSLVLGAAQSSDHFFKISLLYNSKRITLPYVFALNFFDLKD